MGFSPSINAITKFYCYCYYYFIYITVQRLAYNKIKKIPHLRGYLSPIIEVVIYWIHQVLFIPNLFRVFACCTARKQAVARLAALASPHCAWTHIWVPGF